MFLQTYKDDGFNHIGIDESVPLGLWDMLVK